MSAATRKGRATDEAFKEAARVVFARDGYLNAKISDIAAEGRPVRGILLQLLRHQGGPAHRARRGVPRRGHVAGDRCRSGAGLARPEALREAVAGFWRTYAKRRGELIGIFQAAMVEGRFRDRWLELRGEAISADRRARSAAAQARGYCPGVDPVMTASALSAMLEHFCYIWLGAGGEKDVPFDDERALEAVATIWARAVYWRPEEASALPCAEVADQRRPS